MQETNIVPHMLLLSMPLNKESTTTKIPTQQTVKNPKHLKPLNQWIGGVGWTTLMAENMGGTCIISPMKACFALMMWESWICSHGNVFVTCKTTIKFCNSERNFTIQKILQPTWERMWNLLVPQSAQASLALRGHKQGTTFWSHIACFFPNSTSTICPGCAITWTSLWQKTQVHADHYLKFTVMFEWT